jgi:hypothetical protein
MDIPMDAKVICPDGACGQVSLVILMPATEKITHLVINDQDFPETEYLVPIEDFKESEHGSIKLELSREELSKMPVFDKEEFLPPYLGGPLSSPYMMWPYFAPEVTFKRIQENPIPADELAIRRGAQVEAQDGHVGRVDEFLIEPENNLITHLVLREGHLWGQKDVTIPISEIDHYQGNTVFLKIDKQTIEALPAISIRRPSDKKMKT